MTPETRQKAFQRIDACLAQITQAISSYEARLSTQQPGRPPAGPPAPPPPAPPPPPGSPEVEVPPSEMIAGVSGSEFSSGELTYETTEGGQDFDDGTRQNAAAVSPNHNAMQSPNLASAAPALRYGIGFLCSKYPPGFATLPDVAAYSTPNSAYLRAFSGMARSQQYENLGKGAIVARIREWITALARALPAGQTGRLVVSFQGHGGGGSFSASDGQDLTSGEMAALARQAEAQRVSITYVLDACFAGAAVPEFQDHAATSVDRRVNRNVEGAGQQSSVANHAAAEALRDQMAHARELINFNRALSPLAENLNMLSLDASTPAEEFTNQKRAVRQMIQSMQAQFHANMHFGQDLASEVAEIDAAFNEVLGRLNSTSDVSSYDHSGTLGNFQDRIATAANHIIQRCQAASR